MPQIVRDIDPNRSVKLEQLRAELEAAGVVLSGDIHTVSTPDIPLQIVVPTNNDAPSWQTVVTNILAAHVPQTVIDQELATLAAILDKDDAQVTANELKQVALGALRRLRRTGRL